MQEVLTGAQGVGINMSKSPKQVWDECIKIISAELPAEEFKQWFMPCRGLDLVNGNDFTLQVPSETYAKVLDLQYIDHLEKALVATLGPNPILRYKIIIDSGNGTQEPLGFVTKAQTSYHPSSNGKPAVQEKSNKVAPRYTDWHNEEELQNEKIYSYTFENYVEGDCNRLARAAGEQICMQPGKSHFNPLMIYGGVGLGKTHLVHAINNRIKQLHPEKKVVYSSCEKFTSQVIGSMKDGTTRDFNQFFMNVDVLIIDDIQFLAHKHETQKIFFNLFNHLQQRQRQIIMTSDCPPTELKEIHERLRTRFKSGLVTDLQQPNFETRVAIIQKKLEYNGVEVPEEVIEYLARSVATNVRELEGVLISLIAQNSLMGKEFNLALAQQIIKNIVKDVTSNASIDEIQKKVGEYFDVPVELLKDKGRKQEIARVRQVAMYMVKELTTYSLKAIGQNFGGRDHTTVLHAIKAVKQMVDEDAAIKEAVETIQKQLLK